MSWEIWAERQALAILYILTLAQTRVSETKSENYVDEDIWVSRSGTQITEASTFDCKVFFGKMMMITMMIVAKYCLEILDQNTVNSQISRSIECKYC